MKLCIIGAGVVGQATGKGFARYGYDVLFVDVNEEVVSRLEAEGYKACNAANREEWQAMQFDVHFVCVPEGKVGEVVMRLPKKTAMGSPLVVIRSTVLPGTATELSKETGLHVCSNPEFLREAVAEFDFLNPPGIIIGECCSNHGLVLKQLYEPFRRPIHCVVPEVAELTKLAVNGYLACNISYWNSVKLLADKLGINSQEVGSLACFGDGRVSPYGARMHGKAYGGACLPKDLDHIRELCAMEGVTTTLFDAIRSINDWYLNGGCWISEGA